MAGRQTKEAAVRKLVHQLQDNLSTHNLDDARCEQILDQLKIYGRDPAGADAIYSKFGIELLCHYAFKDGNIGISQGALKCIANALLLQPQLRSTFVALGNAPSIAMVYQRENSIDEFLAARILFLLTYGTKIDLEELSSSHDLDKSMSIHLARHASMMTDQSRTIDQMDSMAMLESLKLLFNLVNSYPSLNQSLSVAVPSIRAILVETQVPKMPLEAPVNVIINALAILDDESISTPSAKQRTIQQDSQVMKKIVSILEMAVKMYTANQLDTQAIPILTVLRALYITSSADIQRETKSLLLPGDNERDLPLGKSSSLASRLLRLTISPGLTNLPETISSLMFELSDKDASTFVKNIGYGYAAGYLMTHKIPIPESARQTQGGEGAGDIPINPITGQRLDKEITPDLPEMTPEEKEREAERLFVLFERLKATGVVDVKNPVQQAMEDGRLEGVDSDND